MKKLKWDCPFCGSTGELVECVITNDGKPYRYQCSNDENECEVNPATLWQPTKKKARKVWNRRAK